MSSLESLKSQRGYERADITKICKRVDEIRAKGISERDPAELSSILENLQKHGASCVVFDAEIQQIAKGSSEELEKEKAKCAHYADIVAQAVALLRVMMGPQADQSGNTSQAKQPVPLASQTSPHHPANPITNASFSTSAQAGHSGPLHSNSTPQTLPFVIASSIPALDVSPEPFSGDRKRFRVFLAQFENLVRRRPDASGIDKLVILTKYLREAPRELISSLELIDENYEVALELLRENYGQEKLIKQQFLAALLAIPRVKHASDTRRLRELLNTVQSNTRTLQALNCPLHEYAVAFAPTLQVAIPQQLVFDFEERRFQASTAQQQPEDSAQQASKDITELLAYLSRFVSRAEQTQALLGSTSAPDPGRSPPGREGKGSHSSIFSQGSRYGRKGNVRQDAAPLPCIFCGSLEHKTWKCSADVPYNRKVKVLNEQHRCLRCLRKGHAAKDCRQKFVKCPICSSSEHFPSMHVASSHTAQASSTPNEALVARNASQAQSLLQVASAFVVSGGAEIPVQLFLDLGSDNTFVDGGFLDLVPGNRPLYETSMSVQGFVGEAEGVKAYQRHKLRLRSTHDDSQVDLLCYRYDQFKVNPTSSTSPEVIGLLKRFNQTNPLADRALLGELERSPPRILVGADQYYKIASVGMETAIQGSLVGKKTRFGWVVAGSPSVTAAAVGAVPHIRTEVHQVNLVCCAASLSQAAQDVERLWRAEHFGKGDLESTLSADEASAVEQFDSSVSLSEGSYTVAVPKKPTISSLVNNKSSALKRLKSKVANLQKDAATYERYDREIRAFTEEGHAVEVLGVDLNSPDESDGTFYIPHHQVITKTAEKDKWRIVFDCSSHCRGTSSLNDHLLVGPNLNPDVLDLLLKFRLHPVVVSADVSKAYLRINLAEEDRRLFRFLWRGPQDDQIRCYEMKKVTWGAAPSGFLLAATLRHHIQQVDPDDEWKIGSYFYHDDFLRSFPDREQACTFIEKINDWLPSVGMELAKWKSNLPEVLHLLRQKGHDIPDFADPGPSFLKVLGISWSPTEDQLQIDVDKVCERFENLQSITKRNALSLVASVFDPAGWLAPFTIRGKLLIQSLWTENLRWEDKVNRQSAEILGEWCREVPLLKKISIERLCGIKGKETVARRLHIFGDASERAYAAVAYLQSIFADGSSTASIVMAKSKLAPLAKESLPRLELLAALMAARLRRFICEKLDIHFEEVHLYTDSMITYNWCTAENAGRWKTYVANRVREIQSLSSPEEWYFVPGESNVADLATRGVPAGRLLEATEWWEGPNWLALPNQQQPAQQPRQPVSVEGVQKELRAVVSAVAHQEPLLDLAKFSSLEKAIRTLANVLKFVCRSRKREMKSQIDLLREAELRIIRWAQEQHFKQELAAVQDGDKPPRNSKISSFNLFIDKDGLLRARTRLTRGPFLSYDEKCPIIVPGDSRLAQLIIVSVHRTNAHFGVGTVLSHIRRRFWVTRGRQVIRSVLRRCVVCRKRQGQFGDEVQAPLPEDRVQLIVPFSTTGIDFCGPFHVRHLESSTKVYIALFTCAATRAVHLEVVNSMNTTSFLLALRRFLAAYPGCRKVVTDNFRSFKRAATDIKSLFNRFREAESRELLEVHRIAWEFICPRAPWHGGFYERLVGSVKSALRKTLGKRLVTFDEFRTVCSEISEIINQRPLSYATSDLDEPVPVTPSQLLRGTSPGQPLCNVVPLDHLGDGESQAAPTAARLRAAVKSKDQILRQLSLRWQEEYLLQLRSANLDNRGQHRPIQVGDVCILKEAGIVRSKWPLVRVVSSHTGRDGRVRQYVVRFANGLESRRAVQMLCPLEVID